MKKWKNRKRRRKRGPKRTKALAPVPLKPGEVRLIRAAVRDLDQGRGGMKRAVQVFERLLLQRARKRAQGKKVLMGKILGMSRLMVHYKLRTLKVG